MDSQHTKHVTYKLAYHFVWCPKYRKKILIGKLATCIEQEIRRICEANTWTSLRTQCTGGSRPLVSQRSSFCCSLTDRSYVEGHNRP